MRERNVTVDYLRGLSMFVMVWVHTNAYFLHIPLANFLWDFFEFSVPVFIFCSAYLFFQREFEFSFTSVLSFFKKRLIRLLIPYYVFVLFFLALMYGANPERVTPMYILQNFTLSGGADINWLIVLFLFFSIIMPLVHHWYKTRSPMLWIFTIASFGASIYFLFGSLPLHYKLTNWLPWSLMILYTLYLVKLEKKRWFFPVTIGVSLLLFLVTRQYQVEAGHSLLHYHNKYPPNLYHLSFGFLTTTCFYWLFSQVKTLGKLLDGFLFFLSKNSYPIYFVHFLIIFYVTVYHKFQFTWLSFFACILLLTVVTQWGLNYFFSILKKAN